MNSIFPSSLDFFTQKVYKKLYFLCLKFFLPQKNGCTIVVNTIIIIRFCVVNNIASMWKKVYGQRLCVSSCVKYKLKIIMLVIYISYHKFHRCIHTMYRGASFLLNLTLAIGNESSDNVIVVLVESFLTMILNMDWKVGWFEIHEIKQLTNKKNKLQIFIYFFIVLISYKNIALIG